jgi:hypothetical protein
MASLTIPFRPWLITIRDRQSGYVFDFIEPSSNPRPLFVDISPGGRSNHRYMGNFVVEMPQVPDLTRKEWESLSETVRLLYRYIRW